MFRIKAVPLCIFILMSSLFVIADEYSSIIVSHGMTASSQVHDESSEFSSVSVDIDFVGESIEHGSATVEIISRHLDFLDSTNTGHGVGMTSESTSFCPGGGPPPCPEAVTFNGNLVTENGSGDTRVLTSNSEFFVGGKGHQIYSGNTLVEWAESIEFGIRKAESLQVADISGSYGLVAFAKEFHSDIADSNFVGEHHEFDFVEFTFDGGGSCTLTLEDYDFRKELPWPLLTATPTGDVDLNQVASSCSYSVDPATSTLTMSLMFDDDAGELQFNVSSDYQFLTLVVTEDESEVQNEGYLGFAAIGIKRAIGFDNSALSGYYFEIGAFHELQGSFTDSDLLIKRITYFDPTIQGVAGAGYGQCVKIAVSQILGGGMRFISGTAGADYQSYLSQIGGSIPPPPLDECSYKVLADGTVDIVDGDLVDSEIYSVIGHNGEVLLSSNTRLLDPGGTPYSGEVESPLSVGSAAYAVSIAADVEDMDFAFDAFFPGGADTIEDMDFDGVPNEYDQGAFDPFVRMFQDVGNSNSFRDFIEALAFHGVTSGCGNYNYCPNNPVTREQMAVFLLRGIHGSSYFPPAINQTRFNDVPMNNPFAAWIEQLAAEGVTSGCGNNNYCPKAAVTRAQMAVFLLRSKYGSGFFPPAIGSTGFNDVLLSNPFAAWIAKLAADGVTSGCAVNLYCPDASVTRAQMAVFLVRTFGLPLYFTPLLEAAAVVEQASQSAAVLVPEAAGGDDAGGFPVTASGSADQPASRYRSQGELPLALQARPLAADAAIRHSVNSGDGGLIGISIEADNLS